MVPLYWIAWSAMCAVVTGVLVFFVMQSRMEVLLSRQREELAGSRAEVGAQKKELSSQRKILIAQKNALQDSIRYLEDSARSRAIDEFLREIRVEERHYVREETPIAAPRKRLIRQERIFFRNIPLSSWMEQEMPYVEGLETEQAAPGVSAAASEDIRSKIKLLR